MSRTISRLQRSSNRSSEQLMGQPERRRSASKAIRQSSRIGSGSNAPVSVYKRSEASLPASSNSQITHIGNSTARPTGAPRRGFSTVPRTTPSLTRASPSEWRHDHCMIRTHELSAHDIRRIAVAAQCDPRSIRNYVRGIARGVTSTRIESALLELGCEAREI